MAPTTESDQKTVLIVGGGSAGISVAARLLEQAHPPRVVIVEPASTHYYQPIWTLVGGGVFDKKISARPMREVLPSGAHWVQDAVATFEPEEDRVVCASGAELEYDYLVVAAGIQLDWERIEGITAELIAEPGNGLCSNYSFETVESTWKTLRNLDRGRAVFTFPSTSIKCAGAPQKIMWLTEHWLERAGLRDRVEVTYASATAGIFGIDRYRRSLEALVEQRDIVTHYQRNLVAVDVEARVATFEALGGGEPLELDYQMLHIVPPQSAPDFIEASPLANEAGWVDVDKYTTQHVRHDNVFSLGDCSSLPTSKTGAAVRKEVPVTVENMLSHMRGEPLEARYDGYASCPLVTGYGRLILAEFDYDGNPAETFPFDQSQERYSMYALKAYGLPEMYWNGMLRGRM